MPISNTARRVVGICLSLQCLMILVKINYFYVEDAAPQRFVKTSVKKVTSKSISAKETDSERVAFRKLLYQNNSENISEYKYNNNVSDVTVADVSEDAYMDQDGTSLLNSNNTTQVHSALSASTPPTSDQTAPQAAPLDTEVQGFLHTNFTSVPDAAGTLPPDHIHLDITVNVTGVRLEVNELQVRFPSRCLFFGFVLWVADMSRA